MSPANPLVTFLWPPRKRSQSQEVYSLPDAETLRQDCGVQEITGGGDSSDGSCIRYFSLSVFCLLSLSAVEVDGVRGRARHLRIRAGHWPAPFDGSRETLPSSRPSTSSAHSHHRRHPHAACHASSPITECIDALCFFSYLTLPPSVLHGKTTPARR